MAASADQISVLSGGAAKSFIEPLAKTFPGHTVKLEFQPMGKLTKSLADGYPADMVVVTSEVLDQVKDRTRIQDAKPIARVGIGVAVNEKAPSPDISTVEAFKKTLLAAKSVVYIDPKVGTSGKHVAEILQRLGIAEQVNRKATFGQGGYITEPVGRGEIELGIHQISEILPVKGVKLAGPLPAELQKYTVYVAVPVTQSSKRQAVSDLIHISPGLRHGSGWRRRDTLRRVTDELKRPVVLAVDDSTDMLALIEKALAMDYEVLTAADAGSGIEKAFGEPRPDLILLDVDMPDVNGFEVCRALKDEALTSSIPVIFLTASSETTTQVEALQTRRGRLHQQDRHQRLGAQGARRQPPRPDRAEGRARAPGARAHRRAGAHARRADQAAWRG